MITDKGYVIINKASYELQKIINIKGRTISQSDINTFLYAVYEEGIDQGKVDAYEDIGYWPRKNS